MMQTIAVIDSPKLSRGLRPSKRMPRNSGFLVKSQGAVGKDGVLQVIDNLTAIDTSVITDGFPYPQMFIFSNMILICGKNKIYEYVYGALELKLTVIPGTSWCAVDFFDYIYMSNGKVAVIRDGKTKTWSMTFHLPIASAMCNYNGQVVIGAPGVEI